MEWGAVGVSWVQASCPRRSLSKAFAFRACKSGLVPRKSQSLTISCRRSALELGQKQGRECQCSLKWEERNRGDRPPFIFFARRTGSLGTDNMGQGLQGSLDFSHHGPGRMWLSLGEITAPPQPQATR